MTVELARGFPKSEDFFEAAPLHASLRELEEESGVSFAERKSFQIRELAGVYENTGTSNIFNAVYKVSIVVSSEKCE